MTTPTEPMFAATEVTACADAAASTNTMALSALRMTRDAIARWTGGATPPAALSRDLCRVSPQARWIAKTQQDLAAWIECGGFSQVADAPQDCLPALPLPVMFDVSSCRRADRRDTQVDAYAD